MSEIKSVLAIYEGNQINIMFEKPKAHDNSYKATVTRIEKAYKDFIIEDGRILFETKFLHEALRTTAKIFRYMLLDISDDSKIVNGDKTYVCSYEISKLIDKSIQENPTGTKKMYLELSEKYYKAIRDSASVKEILIELNSQFAVKRKKLKGKRRKLYKIINDELTGEKLLPGCEFSHIVAVSFSRKIALDVENGLLVNKSTHKIITKRQVIDEEELRNLCIEMGWKINWYERFKLLVDI